MNIPTDNAQAAKRFGLIAQQFCTLVDSAPRLDRNELLVQLYHMLPQLINEAIGLPDVKIGNDGDQDEGTGTSLTPAKARMSHEQWAQLYDRLKKTLGDWDLYWQVFDPTKNNEAIHGSLADDIADIYRDLKKGIDNIHLAPPEDIVWKWRFGFSSHWGKHAIDALHVIHFRLGPY
jgi:hypothetical protein